MTHRPHIVHITPALFGSQGGIFGGAERYVFELARYMARETQTTLVTFGDRADSFTTEEGLKVRILGPAWYVRGQRFNPLHPQMIRALASADIVHCHQYKILASSLCAILGRLTGRRVFATDLGAGAWDFSGYLNTDRWFRGHLHISQYSQQISGHQDKSWAHVIYGGVDAAKFSPDPGIEKESLVVFVGRLMPHKGINYLIEGLPDGLSLEIIGRPYNEEYTRLLHHLAEGKSVRFRENCEDSEIVEAYRRAICVVLPSVYHTIYGDKTLVPELLGQTLLEGMACGTPGICTDVASMPEIVTDGESGLIVRPNDAPSIRETLTWLRNYPKAGRKMGIRARERVLERFTWPIAVQNCFRAYGIA
jgi:glycosyltransferase involved in cell wall biosynthesis